MLVVVDAEESAPVSSDDIHPVINVPLHMEEEGWRLVRNGVSPVVVVHGRTIVLDHFAPERLLPPEGSEDSARFPLPSEQPRDAH
jgi:hypothetical protein